MAGRLEGKVAIITGSSRGLGQYCALGYGGEGATVVIAARTEQETNPRLPGTIYHTAKLIEEAGGQAFPVVCDVGSYESIEAMAKQVLDKFGKIDIVMTNAAVQPPGSIGTMQIRHWELEFRINVNGPFQTIRACLPSMLEAGSGTIINISSVAADRMGSHYGAGKRAVESMTLGLANELRGNGIVVNCLKPVGAIETPGWLYGRAPAPGGGRPEGLPTTPPPDSYVEAAIIMASRTVENGTGLVMNDAQVIEQLADEETKQRMIALNPPDWVAAMKVPVPQNNLFVPNDRPTGRA